MPRRVVDVKKNIKDALKGGSLTWSQLLKQTGVSKGALSKHLKTLIRQRIVLTQINEQRPPVTMYRLATHPYVNLISFITKEKTKEQSEHLLNNILTDKIFKVLIESYDKILGDIFRSFESGPAFEVDIGDVLASIDIHDPLWEGHHKGKGYRDSRALKVQDLLNIDLKDTSKDDFVAFSMKEFSCFSVQIILTIYQWEKHILDSLPIPENLRRVMLEKGDLQKFVVLPFIQKYNIWKEFEKFYKWWREEVTPKISSSIIMIWAAHFWFGMRIR